MTTYYRAPMRVPGKVSHRSVAVGVISMLTKSQIELSCPGCLTLFSSVRVTGRPKVRVKATDCRELYYGGVTVLDLCIHMCPQCGFAGDQHAYKHRELDVPLRLRISHDLAWNLPWARKSTVERYYHALKIAEWDDDSAKELGDLALNGSWAAQEVNDMESARYFQRAAVEHYTFAIRKFDGVEAVDRASVTYLLGELHRRIGNIALANEWFVAAEEVAAASKEQDDKWVVRWARIQRTEPKEFFL